MKVDVIMGGPGREAAVSRDSGTAVAAGLRAAGHDVAELDLVERLDPSALRSRSVVFNIVHGTYGEDGSLQAELEALGRRYVGSEADCSRLCLDKLATKDRVAAAGVPVIPGRPAAAGAVPDLGGLDAGRGLVCKPRCDGSSVGLHLLAATSDLPAALAAIHAEQGPVDVLVETRLPGPEYTVGLLVDPDGELRALPPIHIVPAGDTYDYAAKYASDETEYRFPSPGPLTDRLRQLGRTAFRACGCRHFARADFMADADGEPRFMEINTLPGFTSHSLLPKAAAEQGVDFVALVDRLVHLAAGEGD